MLNKVILQGRLCADPEMRTTQTGTSVTTFTLAVDRDYKGKDGQRDADFLTCVAWKATAEHIDRWFTKGQLALVEGQIQTRNYTDKEGNKRTATEIVVSGIHFCGPKSKAESVDEDEDPGELPF